MKREIPRPLIKSGETTPRHPGRDLSAVQIEDPGPRGMQNWLRNLLDSCIHRNDGGYTPRKLLPSQTYEYSEALHTSTRI